MKIVLVVNVVVNVVVVEPKAESVESVMPVPAWSGLALPNQP